MPERFRDEFELIEWFRRRAGSLSDRVLLGIGDDAALLRTVEDGCVVSCDVLLDGVHFRSDQTSARLIGRKALAVNLSDLAAMAARPTAALVGLVLPRAGGDGLASELLEGLAELAGEFSVAVVGGDTNVWDGPLVVSVTVLGEPVGGRVVTRRGARPGDWILVTGELGGSLSGRHLTFRPRVDEALRLHAAVSLHAMIDVSDGLCADLEHILEESGVGAVLEADRIPVSEEACRAADGRSPLDHALSDGEDFELLFTVSPEDGQRLLSSPPFSLRLSCIGRVVAERSVVLRLSDGSTVPLPPAGWRHRFEDGG